MAAILHFRSHLALVEVKYGLRIQILPGSVEGAHHFTSLTCSRLDVIIPFQVWCNFEAQKPIKARGFRKSRTIHLHRAELRGLTVMMEGQQFGFRGIECN